MVKNGPQKRGQSSAEFLIILAALTAIGIFILNRFNPSETGVPFQAQETAIKNIEDMRN